MALPITTYKSNAIKAIDHQDYGIKISKAGFDANTAADNDLLFNSSWPSLQIVNVYRVNPGDTIAHTLNFPPLGLLFPDNTLDLGNLLLNMSNCTCDATNMYVNPFLVGPASLVVFNLDISIDVDYPYNSKPSVNTRYDPDYGIKVPKLGKDYESTDYRDFILHSRMGSPLVLAVKNISTSDVANPNIVQYTQGMGYPVFVFGYVRAGSTGFGVSPAGSWVAAPLGGQAFPVTFTNGTTSYVQSLPPTTDNASLVVLRSPMFAPTTETFNYV